MKKIIICLLIIHCHPGYIRIFINSSSAQPTIQWQKSLGGTSADYAYSIEQTTDGGYIVAGYSSSNDGDVSGNHGICDYWVVKLSSAGNMQWQKSLGGSGIDEAHSIHQTSDGGYIVVGESQSSDSNVTGNHGDYDYWIVKLDSIGSIQWQKSLGGSGHDWATSVKQTADGGLIVAGWSYSNDGDVTGNHGNADYWIVKLDTTGSMLWQKSLGGSSDDWAASIQQTTDGGYIVAGGSASIDGDVTGNHGSDDCWIVKLDSAGRIQWQKSLGGSGLDFAASILQTADGGYVVAGYSDSKDGDVTGNHDGIDYWIIKLDSGGSLQWKKSMGGSGDDYGSSVQQTDDGGYIVAGGSSSNDGDVTGNHGNEDYWIVKLDSAGTILWQESFGGSGVDYASSIQQTTDKGYIIAGFSDSNDGDITGNHGYEDYWIVKLGPEALPPSANFSAVKTEICSDDCISFTDLSTNANLFIWSFEGGSPSSSTDPNPRVCYQTGGIYNVALIASNSGGSDTLVINNYITVNPAPPAPLINLAGDTLYCTPDTNYRSYQWYCDSAITAGGTNSYLVISKSGNYNVEVTGSDGCEISSGINVVIGLQNYPDNTGIVSIYPDPVYDKFTINKLRFTTGYMYIYNSLGQIIRKSGILNCESPVEVDVSAFPPGIYFARLIGENEQWMGRIVKE